MSVLIALKRPTAICSGCVSVVLQAQYKLRVNCSLAFDRHDIDETKRVQLWHPVWRQRLNELTNGIFSVLVVRQAV